MTYLLIIMGLAGGCGAKQPSSATAQKKSADNAAAATPPAVIDAFGDECKPFAVASTIAGIDARISLTITNASAATHAIGYTGKQLSNFRLNFNEAVLTNTMDGTYSVDVVIRRLSDCRSNNGVTDAMCQTQGAYIAQPQVADVTKKISFVVSRSATDYLSSGTLGQGQNGIISDVVNGNGLIGFLGKLGFLKNMGNGGLSNMTDIANQANQALANAKSAGKPPIGGCATSGQTSTTTGAIASPTPTTVAK